MANEDQTLTVVIKEEGGLPSTSAAPSGAHKLFPIPPGPPPSSTGPQGPFQGTGKSFPIPPSGGPNIPYAELVNDLPDLSGGGVPSTSVPKDSVSRNLGGLATATGKLLPFAIGIGIAIVALKKLVDVVRAVDRMLEDLAETGASFSATIAAAQARREINEVLARFRQARELEGVLPAYVGAKSELDLQMIKIETAITGLIAPTLTEAYALLLDWMYLWETFTWPLIEDFVNSDTWIWLSKLMGTNNAILNILRGLARADREARNRHEGSEIVKQINDFITKAAVDDEVGPLPEGEDIAGGRDLTRVR